MSKLHRGGAAEANKRRVRHARRMDRPSVDGVRNPRKSRAIAHLFSHGQRRWIAQGGTRAPLGLFYIERGNEPHFSVLRGFTRASIDAMAKWIHGVTGTIVVEPAHHSAIYCPGDDNVLVYVRGSRRAGARPMLVQRVRAVLEPMRTAHLTLTVAAYNRRFLEARERRAKAITMAFVQAFGGRQSGIRALYNGAVRR